MNLTGGPHPSAAREGEGEGGNRLGHAQGGEGGARGLLGHKAEKKEGEERKAFSFLFSKQNFQTRFQINFF